MLVYGHLAASCTATKQYPSQHVVDSTGVYNVDAVQLLSCVDGTASGSAASNVCVDGPREQGILLLCECVDGPEDCGTPLWDECVEGQMTFPCNITIVQK